MSTQFKIGLVINAGGASRRMGADKALLPTPPDGRPLLEHMLGRLAPLAPRPIIVVTNDPALPNRIRHAAPIRYVADAYPDTGALGGIATGLRFASGWSWVLACDMPLIDPGVLAHLADCAGTGDRWDLVIPQVDGRWQPLHALYHVRCLPAMERSLARGERRILSCLSELRVREVSEAEVARVDPDFRSFFNANTPAEWARARQWLVEET